MDDAMILKNENAIYMYYEVMEQLEPKSVLDMGMFLKRVGSVSRKIMNREIDKDIWLEGVDFFPEISFPVWENVYDSMTDAETYFSKGDHNRYDLTIVFGKSAFAEKIPFENIVEQVSQTTKYVLVDELAQEWRTQKNFVRFIDVTLDEDVYFLIEYGV